MSDQSGSSSGSQVGGVALTGKRIAGFLVGFVLGRKRYMTG